MLTAIVAVSPDWGIGCGDELLYKNSFDMGFFCGITQEKSLIVGVNTARTLPRLENREVIVLTKDLVNIFREDIEGGYTSLVKRVLSGKVIIGGAKTYKLFAPCVEKIYVTHFFKPSEKQANVLFPIEDYPWVKPESGVNIVSNKEFEIILYSRKE